MATKPLTVAIRTLDGSDASTVTLDAAVFGVETKPSLVSEVTVSAQANQRRSIANALTRGEVRGGGRKPWRQKGTGRARQGSTRSPQWRHGGAVFGPSSERNFQRKINRKARQTATRMVLSALAAADQLYVVDHFDSKKLATTKQAAAFLNTAAPQSIHPMLVTATADPALLRAGRNLKGLMIRSLERLGFLDLMLADKLLLDQSALTALTKRYTTAKTSATPAPVVLSASDSVATAVAKPAKRTVKKKPAAEATNA